MPPPGRRSLLLGQLVAARAGGPQQTIVDELRRVILDGGAPPGTPIPVGEVAEFFGVSPIPVREALKTLVGENLVSHRPHAGYVVAQLTRAELAELYLVRGVLESAALRAAALVAQPADLEPALAAHRALEQSIRDGDIRAYHRESRRFHLALIAPCRMQRLLRMFESAWNVTEPLQPMRHIPVSEREQLHADHQEMLAAFQARDADALVAASDRHHRRLESAISRLPQGAGLLGEDI